MTGKGRFIALGILTIVVAGSVLASAFVLKEQAALAGMDGLDPAPEQPPEGNSGGEIPADYDEYRLEDDDQGTAPVDAQDIEAVSGAPWELGILVFFIGSSAALAALYARLSTDDVLDGVRKDIFEHIEHNPGDHLANITKTMGISSSSARHHLDVLEWSEMIVSHKTEKFRHYYPNRNGYRMYMQGHGYKEVISALRNPTARDIVKLLMAGERANQREIAASLGLHPSTVNWHAGRLIAVDIISKERAGKDMHYRLNAEIDLAKVIALIEGDMELIGTAPAPMEAASG